MVTKKVENILFPFTNHGRKLLRQSSLVCSSNLSNLETHNPTTQFDPKVNTEQKHKCLDMYPLDSGEATLDKP